MTVTAVLNTAVTALAVTPVLGWLTVQAVGEFRFWLEFRDAGRPLPLDLVGPELVSSSLPPLRPGAIVIDAEVLEP